MLPKTTPAGARYPVAVLLAAAAQLFRLPIHPPTLMPSITYVPFILLSGWLGGWGPGMLTTALCTLESLYFATAPTSSFRVGNPQSYIALGTLAFTGTVTSLLFEHVIRSRRADKAMAEIRTQLAREVEARHSLLESVIRNSPTAIALLRGPDFTIETVNPAYQELSPGEIMVGRTVAEVWPEAIPVVIPLLRVVRDAGVVYHATGQKLPMHRGPGSPVEERYFDFSYVPLTHGGDVRVLAVAIEVTAHKRAESKLRAAGAELAAIHANAPVVLFVINEDLRVEKVNDLAVRFAGPAGGGLVGRRLGVAFACLSTLSDSAGCGEGPECAHCPIRAAALDSLTTGAGHEGVEAWLPWSVNGAIEVRCLLVSTAAIEFDQARKVLVCAQDITEQKRTQLALESALAEKTILLKEIHHRVKNNLAVVSSLLSMKADAVTNPTANSALRESQQRVYSMALIHEQLYGNDCLDRINFAEYASQLVRRLHTALAAEPERIAVELALEPIELAIEQAVPCGLILNELLTNAFKYAFQGRERGRIAVSFRETAAIRELSVEDDGVGLPPDQLEGPNTKSLGLRIVGVLTHQLDGTLQHEASSGTRVVLRFPAGGRG